MKSPAAKPFSRRWPTAASAASLWSRPGVAAITIIAVAALAHWPGIRNGYIDWDDDYYVRDNRLLDSAGGLWRIWSTLQTPQYYPLTYTSYWLEHALWGDRPSGYHATNLLLHILNSLLVWLLVRRLGAAGPLAVLTAVLFAAHPVHVASVAWIAERKNTLSGLFFLLSFIAFVAWSHRGGGWCWLAGLVCFAAAMLAKSASAALPLALLWWQWLARRRLSRQVLLAVLPLLVVAVALGMVTIYAEAGQAVHLSLAQRVLLALQAPWFYLAKLLVPVGLSGLYPRWSLRTDTLVGYWPLAAAFAALAVLAWSRKRIPALPLFGLGFFLITLLPSLGLIPFGYMEYSFVADHFVYLPSVGLLLAVGFGALWLGRELLGLGRGLGVGIGVVVVALLAAASWRRTGVWHDPLTFWNDVLATNPASVVARYNLGVAYERRGQPDRAVQLFEQALALRPDFADAHVALGIYHLRRGQRDQAGQALRRAIALQPTHPTAHYYLGLVLEQAGQPRQAELAFRRALQLRPSQPETCLHLGNVLVAQGRLGPAGEAYRQAIALQPDYAEAWLNLGNVLGQAGRPTDALHAYNRAIQFRPGSADAWYNKGQLLLKLGRLDQARQALERALSLRPDHPPACNALAWLLATSGDPAHRDGARALALASTAVRLTDRRQPRYLSTLAAAWAELGRFDQAVRIQRRALALLPADRPDLKRRFRQHLRSYQRRQPVRMHFGPTQPTSSPG